MNTYYITLQEDAPYVKMWHRYPGKDLPEKVTHFWEVKATCSNEALALCLAGQARSLLIP